MKKYLQISIVLGSFFLLVLLKNLRGGEDDARVVNKPIDSITPTASVVSSTPNPSNNPSQPSTSPTPTPKQQPIPSSTSVPTSTPAPQPTRGKYRDGTFTGSVEDAYYGNIQIQAVIIGGRIINVNFLQFPNDNRTSLSINSQALPILKEEAIQAQSEQIDMVSGASDSSPAFQRSLASALSQAK